MKGALKMEIRLLKANEIECRIGSVKATGMSLLLYKDARADMKILDETFGFDGWERKHELIDGKLFCTVKVWSEKRGQWISKQDVGTESNAEKEKGQASDSFKRACVNLGIGRELYTSPLIWISANKGYDKYEKFKVKEIGYNENKEINKLVIVDSKGSIAFNYGSNIKKDISTKENPLLEEVYKLAEEKGYKREVVNKTIINKGFSLEKFDNVAYETIYKGFYNLENKSSGVGA